MLIAVCPSMMPRPPCRNGLTRQEGRKELDRFRTKSVKTRDEPSAPDIVYDIPFRFQRHPAPFQSRGAQDLAIRTR
jgi:hypothetical protein